LSQLRDCEIGKVQASVEYMVITMFSVWNWKVSQIQVKLQFPVSHRLNSPSPDAMRIRP
jgi:hypothetical protein